MDYVKYLHSVFNLAVSAGGLHGKSVDECEDDIVDCWFGKKSAHQCVQHIRARYPFQNREGLIDQTETYGYDTACSDEVNMLVDCALTATNPEFTEDSSLWVMNNHDIAINGGIVFG